MMIHMMMISRLDCRAPVGWLVGGTIDRSGIPTGTDAPTTPFLRLQRHLVVYYIFLWVFCTISWSTTPFIGLLHHLLVHFTIFGFNTKAFIGLLHYLLVYPIFYWSTALFISLLHHLLVYCAIFQSTTPFIGLQQDYAMQLLRRTRAPNGSPIKKVFSQFFNSFFL